MTSKLIMEIYVSSIQAAHHSVVEYQPKSIISFIDTETSQPYFLNYDENNHLVIKFNDISLSNDDIHHEQRIACGRLINFLTSHDMRYPMLIHCTLGISRSTAAAYIALNLHLKNKEYEIAQYLRSKIPYAVPNITLISIADSLLGSNGSMKVAIEALPSPIMSEAGGCKMVSTDFY